MLPRKEEKKFCKKQIRFEKKSNIVCKKNLARQIQKTYFLKHKTHLEILLRRATILLTKIFSEGIMTEIENKGRTDVLSLKNGEIDLSILNRMYRVLNNFFCDHNARYKSCHGKGADSWELHNDECDATFTENTILGEDSWISVSVRIRGNPKMLVYTMYRKKMSSNYGFNEWFEVNHIFSCGKDESVYTVTQKEKTPWIDSLTAFGEIGLGYFDETIRILLERCMEMEVQSKREKLIRPSA